jgi:oxalate decarboxylase
VYFIPRAYPHHIENLTDSKLRFLIFFDTPDVQDIGFTGAIPADLLIVSKTNSVFNRP